MSQLFEIGKSSLLTTQKLLNVSGQNIANANNPHYARREANIKALSAGGLIGSGVTVASIRRIIDDVNQKNLLKCNAALGSARIKATELQGLESLIDDDNNGLAKHLNDTINALNQVNSSPSNMQHREIFMRQLQTVVGQFKTISQSLNEVQNQVNARMQNDVSAINQLTARLANLNNDIGRAGSRANLNSQDEREAVLQQLSQFIDFKTVEDDQGHINVLLSNGSTLVKANQASTLIATQSTLYPAKYDLMLMQGQSKTPITNIIQSGELAGLRDFQNQSLSPTQNRIGRLALVLAETFNQQNRLGIDIKGALGGNLFVSPNDTALMEKRVYASQNNQGNAQLSVEIDNITALLASDYELVFDTDTHYQLIRKSDETIVKAETLTTLPHTIEIDGIAIHLNSGTPKAHDRFALLPTYYGATDLTLVQNDPSKIALGWPVVGERANTNQGQGKISITDIIDTQNPIFSSQQTLSPKLKIEFIDADRYRIINADTQDIIESDIPYHNQNAHDLFPTPNGFDPGFRVQLSGDIEALDSFIIDYNKHPNGDNRNGLAFAKCFSDGIVENGTQTLTNAYGSLVGSVASNAYGANRVLENETLLQQQAEAENDEISGVSLEEEALNLARFQQAFQASAEVLDAVKKMFDIIIGLARR